MAKLNILHFRNADISFWEALSSKLTDIAEIAHVLNIKCYRYKYIDNIFYENLKAKSG